MILLSNLDMQTKEVIFELLTIELDFPPPHQSLLVASVQPHFASHQNQSIPVIFQSRLAYLLFPLRMDSLFFLY